MDKIECPICGENMELQDDTKTYRCVSCGYKTIYSITANQVSLKKEKNDGNKSYLEQLSQKKQEIRNYGTSAFCTMAGAFNLASCIYFEKLPQYFWPLPASYFVIGCICISGVVRASKDKNKLINDNKEQVNDFEKERCMKL